MSKLMLRPGTVFQTAFVVENLESALETFSPALNIGGWLVLGGKKPWPAVYRGKPAELDLNVALGFNGEMMFELIEQRDRAASVYMDVIAERGYGFHHWAIGVDDIDEAQREQQRAGHAHLMSLEGRQGKALYFDARPRLSGMLEIVQLTPVFRAFVDKIYALRRDRASEGPLLQRL